MKPAKTLNWYKKGSIKLLKKHVSSVRDNTILLNNELVNLTRGLRTTLLFIISYRDESKVQAGSSRRSN